MGQVKPHIGMMQKYHQKKNIFTVHLVNKGSNLINPPLLTQTLKLIHGSVHIHDHIRGHSIHVHIHGDHSNHIQAQHQPQQTFCHNGTHVHNIHVHDHIHVHSIHGDRSNHIQVQRHQLLQLQVQHQQISCHNGIHGR